MPRRHTLAAAVGVVIALGAGPALACGGLVNPNGSVSLLRTTTLAAYHNGFEHYVTSFEFAGGGAEFGSIVPLPGIPTRVRRAGDWTLQRLVRETQPPEPQVLGIQISNGEAADAEVIQELEIDALDITILRGGGEAVGKWATDNGFVLTPDAPEILDYYADRSPIFMAARFNLNRAQEFRQEVGDGTPIHLKIPLDAPWVPLRILGLGLGDKGPIGADVYLLTDDEPNLLPYPDEAGLQSGYTLERSELASKSLMNDLRSDKGMKWMPENERMWLTYIKIDSPAKQLKFDLATSVSGGLPSAVDAGIAQPPPPAPTGGPWGGASWGWIVAPWLPLGFFAYHRKD